MIFIVITRVIIQSNRVRCKDGDDDMTRDGVSPGEDDDAIRWRSGCHRRWGGLRCRGGKGRRHMEEAVSVADVEEGAATGGSEAGAVVSSGSTGDACRSCGGGGVG